MKSLLDCYTAKELLQVFVTWLKEPARAEPGVRKSHILTNALRIGITYRAETNEFVVHVGRALRHPDKETLEIVRLALGAANAQHVPAREYYVNGILHYAPGFVWKDVPAPASLVDELYALYKQPRGAKRADPAGLNQKQFA